MQVVTTITLSTFISVFPLCHCNATRFGQIITSSLIEEAKYPGDYVCLSVCLHLSVHEHICVTTHPSSLNVLCMLPMAVAWCSSANVEIRYVLAVVCMTSYLHIIGTAM